ncbi:VirB3 family type IV secretion system protein [Cupriavidus necator]
MRARILYSAYAGLGRTATFKGVPLIPGLFVFCASVVAAVVGAAFLGAGGLLFALPGIPVVLFFKHLCATDDQALCMVTLEVLCVLDRRNARCFGNTYTLSPMRYGRHLTDARQGCIAHGLSADRAQLRCMALRGQLTRERHDPQ